MPKPYSEDLRSRAAEAVAAGDTVRAVALHYKVSPAFVCRMQALRVSISAIDQFIRHKLGHRYKKHSSPVNSSARM